MIAWVEMSIDLGNFTREVNSLKYFEQYLEKTREILGIVKYCLILGVDCYQNAIADWPCPIPDYVLFPHRPDYATDIHMKAQQHWEYYLSWMQH